MCAFVLREEKSFLIKEILYLNSLLIGGKLKPSISNTNIYPLSCRKEEKGWGVCEIELHQVRSLDGTTEVLWERKRDSAAIFLGNTFETVMGLRVGFVFVIQAQRLVRFPLCLTGVVIQLAQTSRFFCFTIALYLNGHR